MPAMEAENIIEIHRLNFGFDTKNQILKNVSIQVPKGAIYGFLGANGAGKSTTMRVMLGIYPDDHQSVRLFGSPIQHILPKALHRVGSLIDYPAYYDHLTGYENLAVACKIYNIPSLRIDETLDIVGLSNARNIKAKKYSMGMKQRLAIALALIPHPELLILDEPVNGLDPNGMAEMRALFIQLNQERGTTILISSHLLQEIDKMVTHLGIIAHGEMKFEGRREELNQQFQFQKTKFSLLEAAQYQSKINEKYSSELLSDTELLVYTDSQSEIAHITSSLVGQGAQIYQIAPVGGLEDWFMDITRQN